jgi:hypothetical protein
MNIQVMYNKLLEKVEQNMYQLLEKVEQNMLFNKKNNSIVSINEHQQLWIYYYEACKFRKNKQVLE